MLLPENPAELRRGAAGSPVSCVELAFKYSWIKSTTLTQLFIWTTETFLDSSIKSFIQSRRKGIEVKAGQEEASHGG